jgi:hypothetical protein
MSGLLFERIAHHSCKHTHNGIAWQNSNTQYRKCPLYIQSLFNPKRESKNFTNSKERARFYALFSFTFADCPFPNLERNVKLHGHRPEGLTRFIKG